MKTSLRQRIFPNPIISGDVRIRYADPNTDSKALFDAANGPDSEMQIWRWMHWGPFDTLDTFEAFMLRVAADPTGIALTVDLLDENQAWNAAGQLRIMEISENDRRAELGSIWYIPSVQGKGVSRRVTGILLKHLFETCYFRRIEWKCHHMNVRSAAAAKSYGFTYEGTFRQHMLVKGQNRDTVWFSMLDSEWPSVRKDRYKGILD